MKTLDPYTFGDSKSAVNLAKLLNEHFVSKSLTEGQVSSLCKLVSSHQKWFKQLSELSDTSLRKHMGKLLLNELMERVAARPVPEVIKSHLLNVVNKHYRIYILTVTIPKK
jgi:hypothetical protein